MAGGVADSTGCGESGMKLNGTMSVSLRIGGVLILVGSVAISSVDSTTGIQVSCNEV